MINPQVEFTASQVAYILGVHIQTVYYWTREGHKISGKRTKGGTRIKLEYRRRGNKGDALFSRQALAEFFGEFSEQFKEFPEENEPKRIWVDKAESDQRFIDELDAIMSEIDTPDGVCVPPVF